MLKLTKKIENIGEVLKTNIKYDFSFIVDSFDFLKTKNQKDILFKQKIDNNLNRKITSDDKL